MGKIISIAPKLNFTPNTLGCYGLTLLTQINKLLAKYFSMQNKRTSLDGKYEKFRVLTTCS